MRNTWLGSNDGGAIPFMPFTPPFGAVVDIWIGYDTWLPPLLKICVAIFEKTILMLFLYRNLPRWWIVWMMRKLSSWLVRARPGRVRLIPYWSILHLNRNISTNPNSNDFDPNALFNGIFRIIRCGSKVNLCVICVAFFNFSKTFKFFDFFYIFYPS